ncbi:MAG: hypothetical protein Q4G63_12425 [Bacteroidia bacterium]|nr:hypothetical protein [Bacteroidia bacterium]
MKDQRKLVTKCLMNDIPAFVLCGTDINALEALREYERLANKNGCSNVFLDDLRLLIGDFEAYQAEEPESVKIPD